MYIQSAILARAIFAPRMKKIGKNDLIQVINIFSIWLN